MATFTYYGSDVLNGTISTASTSTVNTGGTETSKTTTVSGGNHFAEVWSQGGSIASVTAVSAPTGRGWVTAAPGAGTFATGNWSGSFGLAASGSPSVSWELRFYKYSSGTYTSIGTITTSAATIGSTRTAISFAATSMSSVTFGASDLIYYDLWMQDTTGAGGDSPVAYESTSATAGVSSDAQITTSTFTPAGTVVYKDVTVRGKLSATVYKDISVRGKLSAIGYKDISVRGKVGNTIYKDVTTRGKISAVVFKDVTVRGKISQVARKDITVRGKVGNTIFKDVTTRGKVSAVANKDITVRGKVGLYAFHDITVRGKVGALAFKDITVRGKIAPVAFHDITVRGKVSAIGHKDITVRGKIIARNTIGGVTVWANGTGTATFDSFRATQYPDPALSLAPVLPRLGNTTVAWDEVIPVSASRTVKTSLDGVNWTDVTSGNGAAIPGLTGQPVPAIDCFNTNTLASYTNTSKSGGSAAAITYDTANSRIILSGGSGGLYLYNAISDNDVDLIADMDYSDAGGLVWRYVDANNYYELGAYDDSSSSGFTNQLRLYSVVAGTRALIGSASTVVWPRNTSGTSPYKRIRVTMLGTTITVYFDGVVMQSATDTTFASGLMGLRNDGGTSRCYQLRLQPIGEYVSGTPAGDIVTSQFVYTQATLGTTSPSVNPRIPDLTTTANSPSVAPGVLIPQLHDPTKPFAAFYSAEMDTLTQSSGDFYWSVISNALTFANRTAVPSPWILHSSDLLFTPNVKPTFSADLYRNRETITNCIGTVAVTGEQKIADGTATSWVMAWPLYSVPTITVQGVVKTVAVQGGALVADFYWQAASNSISQNSTAAVIPNGYLISVNYVGQFPASVTRDNLPEQAARKAVEGGTGIVEATEDGLQMLVSAATIYADGLLARFSNNNTVEIQATTRRTGLVKGQVVPAFLAEFSINNAQLLITKIITIGEQLADGTILYQYQITATNGPNLNRWSTALGL